MIVTTQSNKQVIGTGFVLSNPEVNKNPATGHTTISRSVRGIEQINTTIPSEFTKKIQSEVNQLTEKEYSQLTQSHGDLENRILVSKIAWSNNGWRGFDYEGYKNRASYNFRYVKEHGLAHEWWNFYPFDDKYYFGQVEPTGKTPNSVENDALALFISVNYSDGRCYLIGFYSHLEFGQYRPGVKLISTITEPSIQNQILADIDNGNITDAEQSSITDSRIYSCRAKQFDSTVFPTPIPLDINNDLGLKKLGYASYYLVGGKGSIKTLNIKKTLEKAIDFNQELLKSSDSDTTQIRDAIRKTKSALSYYFDVSDIGEGRIVMKKLSKILENKKQVILYGPPGTGKTFSANRFIKAASGKGYPVSEERLIDQRIYSITIYEQRDGAIKELNAGETFTYEWGAPGHTRRNWQKYFNEIQEGDIALAYTAVEPKKYTTILQCTQKDNHSMEFKVIEQFNGPTFQQLRASSELKRSMLATGSMGFSLKKLSESEVKGIISLSAGLSADSLPVSFEKVDDIIENYRFVTFHPSFGYEDFIEGLRPKTDEDNQIRYQVEDGIFKKFSRDAFNVLMERAGINKCWEVESGIPELSSEEKIRVQHIAGEVPFYLVIDEINRGDISRIFGELITLLEADKRLSCENELITLLPYSKEKFAIPPNLFIIATMNTADKSIALVDVALRRRFGFIEMMPDYDMLREYLDHENAAVREVCYLGINALEQVNAKIISGHDRDHQIGHSYLIKMATSVDREEAIENLRFIWYYEIIPLLQEYYYDSPKKLREVLGEDFVALSENRRSFTFKEERTGEDFVNILKGFGEVGAAATRNEE